MSSVERPSWIEPLAGLVGERLGLAFPRERWTDLERNLRLAAHEMGVEDTESFAHRLLSAAPEDALFETLASALTVGETYFFREPRSFEVLEHEILPALIASRQAAGKRLRLWSAGCCTGEEAYSLAILIDRLLPRRDDWHITILATDVNPRFLRAAARGEFAPWSFRNAPAGLLERYFRPAGGQGVAIDPRIRRMVSFAQLNLAEPSYPDWRNGTEAMDVILCRNVLMYFAPAHMRQVLGRFRSALVDGGWLSVSATETSVQASQCLTPTYFEGVVFYRKAPPPDLARANEGMAFGGPAPVELEPAAGLHEAGSPTSAAPPAHHPALQDADGSLLQQARAHADAGRMALAHEAVEKAMVPAKLDAGAHYLRAIILQELGQDLPARDALRSALYLEPDFVMAHHALGQLALRHGRVVEAERHFGNALRLLARQDAQAVLPHSDGLAAGHLQALIQAALATRRVQ